MVVEWWSILPFVALLGCIAVLPLIPATEHAWEKNSVKLLVALACGLPVATWFLLAGHGGEVVHALFEYVQFIMLLLALFVVPLERVFYSVLAAVVMGVFLWISHRPGRYVGG